MHKSAHRQVLPRTGAQIAQPVALATGLLLGAVGASCGQAERNFAAELPGPQPKESQTASQAQPLLGSDGSKVVAVFNTYINTYSKVVADIKAGDTQIQVADVGTSGLKLASGDLVMIIQMQGATIDASDSASYGSIANAAALGGAGRYEIASVAAVDTAQNTITIGGCGGTKNAYAKGGHTQVVRVPQYTSLDVGLLGSITAPVWNGDTGGVIAAYVEGKTTIAATGSIDASGSGFRGGASENMTADPAMNITSYRSSSALDAAERGEGIAGYQSEYDSLYGGRYGRGAAANGGGGGNSHNGGGGGGANGLAPGKTWSGAGVMVAPNNNFASAWALDPAFAANGNALTDSAGGGRGGYTYASTNQDATTVGPNQAAWGGNNRHEAGGLGGRPVDNNPAGRLFLGGGGGAGDGNDNSGGAGGAGGGLIFLVSAGGVEGTGGIVSNGSDGERTKIGTTGNDAPGGGGAGGTVVVVSGRSVTGVQLRANGGAGGSQFIGGAESEGPGGGGGGGYIAVFAQQNINGVNRVANGGASGVSDSTSVTEFNVNGATDGAAGQPSAAIPPTASLPVCIPSDLVVTATHTQGTVAPGSTIQLTVNVRNTGPQPASAAAIADSISNGLGPVAWTCTAAGGAACPAPAGTNSIAGVSSIPPGGALTFVISVVIPANFTGFPFTYNVGASVPPGYNDPDLTNNSASLSLGNGTAPGADLALDVSANPNPAQPGSPIVYDLQVTNRGPGPAGGATLSYNLPAGATAMLTTVPQGWICGLTAGMVNCTYAANIPPGSLPAVVVTVTPPAGATSADSSALVTGLGVSDPDSTNNRATSSVPIGNFPAADLSVSLNSMPNPAPQGSDVIYDIRVSNAGPNAATGASLSFAIPPGSTLKNIAAPQGWSCSQSSSSVSCTYGAAIAVGTLPDVRVTVTPAAATTSLVATAQVVGQGIMDTNSANNKATETNPVGNSPPQADLVLKVTVSPESPQRNMPVVYTLDVSNKGPGTATGAVVNYTVPEGGTVQSIEAPAGWDCSRQDRTVSCWYNRDIAPNSAAPDIRITVLAPAGATSISATADATPKGAVDPNPNDNKTTVTTQVASTRLLGGGFSLGCSAAPSSAAQPGAAGGFLASLLGLLGLARRRRRG